MRLYYRYIVASFCVCADDGIGENILLEAETEEKAISTIAWLTANPCFVRGICTVANDNEMPFPEAYLPSGFILGDTKV